MNVLLVYLCGIAPAALFDRWALSGPCPTCESNRCRHSRWSTTAIAAISWPVLLGIALVLFASRLRRHR